MTEGEQDYLLPNRQIAAGARLAALSELFDPSTFRHLVALGIEPGWHCWEVGAGRPEVAEWMAERVGPEGSVLVTDIDVTHLTDLGPGVQVRRHDVGTDRPPNGPFDVIHARLVLTHVPARSRAVAAMAGVSWSGWRRV